MQRRPERSVQAALDAIDAYIARRGRTVCSLP